MHQLLLLRHAKSSWDDPNQSDHARPLSPRGWAAAQAMRRAFHDLGLAPDLVVVSSARRTLQTLEGLEPWDETPLIEPLDSLYLAPAPAMLQALQTVSPTVRSLLVVGHNPGLHELAMMLVGPEAMARPDSTLHRLAQAYPSGALAEFSVPGSWAELREGGARLVRFLCPRDLPEAAA